MEVDTSVPRYDFYQTDAQVIVSLYIKGYNVLQQEQQAKLKIDFQPTSVDFDLPALNGGQPRQFSLNPLIQPIQPDSSSFRLLSSKIELKLSKATANNWSSLVGGTGTSSSTSAPSSQPTASPSAQSAQPTQPLKKERRNWDKVIDAELEDDPSEAKDPNAGGDAALKDFFSKLYKDADEDTRRAMIKSYTESGGTTLSTNWSEIGSKKTATLPPEGMEARKY